jgi:hypothetical protein
LLALGVSVAEVTEASVSGATNRPQEELVDWLRSWDNRIATLRDEALPLLSGDAEAAAPNSNEESNAPSSATVSDSPSDLSPDTPASANEGQGDEKAWNELIGRWEDYLRRIAGVENALTDPDVGASALSSQWQATSVVSMVGAAETVPTIRTRSDAAEVSQAISLLVGLVMMAGCGTLAWMFRATLAKPMAHPAVWLFAVGLASLAVAPTPVAIAICLVAVSAPMLAGRPTSSVAGSSKSFVARPPSR